MLTTCQDEAGNVLAMKYQLVVGNDTLVDLEGMGSVEDCNELPLTTSRFESLRASFRNGGSSIAYFKQGIKKTYGEMPIEPDQYTSWTFSDDNRLIGLHGRVEEGVIRQLGVITVSQECGAQTV